MVPLRGGQTAIAGDKAAAWLLLITYTLLYKIRQYDMSPPEYLSPHLGAPAREAMEKGANPVR